MQFFYNVLTTQPIDSQSHVLWHKNQYQVIACDQTLPNHVTPIKFGTAFFDKAIEIFQKYDFQPSFFTAQASNHPHINEYDGDELKPDRTDKQPCRTFENETKEQIQTIQFNQRDHPEIKIVIQNDGLVGYNHLTNDFPKMWNAVIKRFLNNTTA